MILLLLINGLEMRTYELELKDKQRQLLALIMATANLLATQKCGQLLFFQRYGLFSHKQRKGLKLHFAGKSFTCRTIKHLGSKKKHFQQKSYFFLPASITNFSFRSYNIASQSETDCPGRVVLKVYKHSSTHYASRTLKLEITLLQDTVVNQLK